MKKASKHPHLAATLLLAAGACAPEPGEIPEGPSSPPATSEAPAVEPAYRFLRMDYAVRVQGSDYQASPSFEERRLSFRHQGRGTAAEWLGELARPDSLPLHPISLLRRGDDLLAVFGLDPDGRTCVLQRWLFTDPGAPAPPPDKGDWLIPERLWIQDLIRFEPAGGLRANAIAAHPTDPKRFFAVTHQPGHVLAIDLDEGSVSTLASPTGSPGLAVPQLGQGSWNSIHAEVLPSDELQLTLLWGDFYCTIERVGLLIDTTGDGALDSARFGPP